MELPQITRQAMLGLGQRLSTEELLQLAVHCILDQLHDGRQVFQNCRPSRALHNLELQVQLDEQSEKSLTLATRGAAASSERRCTRNPALASSVVTLASALAAQPEEGGPVVHAAAQCTATSCTFAQTSAPLRPEENTRLSAQSRAYTQTSALQIADGGNKCLRA
eukprot:CAMPEP_0180704776 /NCGR_PEP_ID=MMETSP1038_2-20121128/7328_1 /TAXON_ID=632150 /ORGANISM="Azadinium spinosum, Strain 3D9" /LENGTH=164 /DNA_ID=CAMNT_0022736615 /DNA_START=96 /DNA_END=591 /DNA_ORIENTATION=+